ncbi:MAG TPA: hypothetical protein VFE37_18935 [Chloroflexota bacterium]|nr:hypothetical protein [Chloroflexota bacterium]
MKRRNVQMAFVGEGTTADYLAPENLMMGDDAVDFVVTGGKLMVVAPAGTPDDELFTQARRLGGELLLENGLRLSFEIEGEAAGAQFTATAHAEHDTHAGLSSLPDIPGGV